MLVGAEQVQEGGAEVGSLPMLVVAVAGLVTAASAAPRWLGTTAAGGPLPATGLLLLALVVMLAQSVVQLEDITAVRLRRVATAVEATAVVLVVPLVLLVFNAYDFVRGSVS